MTFTKGDGTSPKESRMHGGLLLPSRSAVAPNKGDSDERHNLSSDLLPQIGHHACGAADLGR